MFLNRGNRSVVPLSVSSSTASTRLVRACSSPNEGRGGTHFLLDYKIKIGGLFRPRFPEAALRSDWHLLSNMLSGRLGERGVFFVKNSKMKKCTFFLKSNKWCRYDLELTWVAQINTVTAVPTADLSTKPPVFPRPKKQAEAFGALCV